jgi:predicted AAA+ superfamily ATPase
MPEVVESYRLNRSLIECQRLQSTLINTYRQDFNKYAKRHQLQYLERVFESVPRLLGQKIKYSHIEPEVSSRILGDAMTLLCQARVVFKNFHSAANGVPLGSEINPRHFKCIFVDIGLALRILGLELSQILESSAVELINSGAIAEQLVGQELLANTPITEIPQLYHWHREARTSNAEIDYVIQQRSQILPIEVKAGATGRLKSLHQFLIDKPQHKLGVRIYSGPYNRSNNILSLPVYLVGSLMRGEIETEKLAI